MFLFDIYNKSIMINVKCQGEGCDNEFNTYPYLLKQGFGKFCSKECRFKDKRKSKEHIREGNNRRAKKWRLKNKNYGKSKKIKDYKKTWYEKNKERILEKRKVDYDLNPEKFKDYRKQNKEKIKVYNKIYCKTDVARASTRNSQHKRRLVEKDTDIDTSWLKEQKQKAIYCPLCDCKMEHDGRKMKGKTLDHLIVINKGGPHKKNNVLYMCRECNLSRPKNNSDIKKIYEIILYKDIYLTCEEKKPLLECLGVFIENSNLCILSDRGTVSRA